LARLLVVHHTPSPAMQEMLEAVVSGARDPELEGIEVTVMPALAATVPDVLAADGFVLGTPANIGYMSGALKHFFDQIYYPCLQAKIGAPYGLYVHGATDTTGAVRAVAAIAKGLGWTEVVNPVVATGPVGKDAGRQCYDLGATVAANLLSSLTRRNSRVDRLMHIGLWPLAYQSHLDLASTPYLLPRLPRRRLSPRPICAPPSAVLSKRERADGRPGTCL
jgi:multimeric flavodoxin WrbA